MHPTFLGIYFVYLCACTRLRVRYWLGKAALHIGLEWNKLWQLCNNLCCILTIISGSVRTVSFSHTHLYVAERIYSRITPPLDTMDSVCRADLASKHCARFCRYILCSMAFSGNIFKQRKWVSIQGVWINLIHGSTLSHARAPIIHITRAPVVDLNHLFHLWCGSGANIPIPSVIPETGSTPFQRCY